MGSPDLAAVRDLIDRGEYLRAWDICREPPPHPDSEDIEWPKVRARSSALLGMLEEAIGALEAGCREPGVPDAELFALMGGFYKRQWIALREDEPERAARSLLRSFESYARSLELGGDYWCAVNAATLARIMGRTALAVELAGRVIEECWSEYCRQGTSTPFWAIASLGEASLVRGDCADAARWFGAARGHLSGNFGWVASTRNNVRLLLSALGSSAEDQRHVMESVPSLGIAVFAGHRLDESGRASPRLPRGASEQIRKRLERSLVDQPIDMGIASAADGSDILFHECLHALGRPTMVVLPCPVDHFSEQMDGSAGPEWVERLDKVLANALSVEIASTSRFRCSSPQVYAYGSDFLLGLALDTAKAYDADLLPIVVWDGRSSPAGGGTSYFVSRLVELGLRPKRIPVPGGRAGQVGTAGNCRDDGSPVPFDPTACIAAVFTLDGSGPCEDEAAALNALSGAVAQLCRQHSMRIVQGTVEPGVMCVLVEPVSRLSLFAESCATDLDRRLFRSIVIHVGLSLEIEAPQGGRRNFLCRDLSDAMAIARDIETPGGIYCTLQARSLMTVQRGSGIRFNYRGRYSAGRGVPLRIFQVESPGRNPGTEAASDPRLCRGMPSPGFGLPRAPSSVEGYPAVLPDHQPTPGHPRGIGRELEVEALPWSEPGHVEADVLHLDLLGRAAGLDQDPVGGVRLEGGRGILDRLEDRLDRAVLLIEDPALNP